MASFAICEQLRCIGIGGLLDFDTTLPLVAIHLMLLMIALKFGLLRPHRQISIRRSYVKFGDVQVDKILRVFYIKKIRDRLKNALAARNSVIFALMVQSFGDSLVKKNERYVLRIYRNSLTSNRKKSKNCENITSHEFIKRLMNSKLSKNSNCCGGNHNH